MANRFELLGLGLADDSSTNLDRYIATLARGIEDYAMLRELGGNIDGRFGPRQHPSRALLSLMWHLGRIPAIAFEPMVDRLESAFWFVARAREVLVRPDFGALIVLRRGVAWLGKDVGLWASARHGAAEILPILDAFPPEFALEVIVGVDSLMHLSYEQLDLPGVKAWLSAEETWDDDWVGSSNVPGAVYDRRLGDRQVAVVQELRDMLERH